MMTFLFLPRPAALFLCGLCCLPVALTAQEESHAAAKPAVEGKENKKDTGLFRAVLSGEEYEHRLSGYNPALLDPARVEADESPEWGILVTNVNLGSPAAKAGIQPGWVLVRCDDEELWNKRQSLRPGKERRITVASPDGEEHVYTFQPGKLGVDMLNQRRPGRSLLRRAPRGAWDRELLAAAQAFARGEQDMAETAMNHAEARGMPYNPYSDFYAALFALDRGDREQARDLCDAVLLTVTHNGEIPRFFREGMRTLAVGLNDPDLLRKSSRELADIDKQFQPSLVDAWEKQGMAGMKDSLLPQALARAGEELATEVIVPRDGLEGMLQYSGNDPQTLAEGTVTVPNDERGWFSFAFTGPEPMHDMIWEIKGAYGDRKGRWSDRIFEASLFDVKRRAECGARQSYEPDKFRLCGLRAYNNAESGRRLEFYDGLDAGPLETTRFLPRMSDEESGELAKAVAADEDKLPTPQPAHIFDLKFICIGNEVEIIVNGVSYQRLPVASNSGDLGCQIVFWGHEGRIFSNSLRRLK